MKELDQGYEFTKAQLAELEQLRQRVKVLETSTAYWFAERNELQVKDDAVIASLATDLAAAEHRVAELEVEVSVEEKRFSDQWELLAASQAHNLRLRSALESVGELVLCGKKDHLPGRCDTASKVIIKALSTPTDTEALEKYLADRLGEPVGYFEQEYVGGPVLFYQVNYSEKDTPGVIPLFALKEKP